MEEEDIAEELPQDEVGSCCLRLGYPGAILST